MRKSMRLVDLGEVTPLHSQTIPHAVGHGVSLGRPDTVLLMRSSSDCVSIGKYQELSQDVDMSYCTRHGIPVFRRQTGGGAHFVGDNQLLFYTVFNKRQFTRSITKLNQDILRSVVDTYMALGVDAHYRPISNVFVRETPISRSSVGTVRGAIILASYFVLDLNRVAVSRALRIHEDDTPTSMTAELGNTPDPELVKNTFIEKLTNSIRINLEEGELSDPELAALDELDKEFQDENWLHTIDRRVAEVKALKEQEEAVVAEGRHKKRDEGMIRATVALKNDRIRDIAFAGDIFLNLDHVQGLERSFRGTEAEWDDLMTVAENYYLGLQVDSPGTDPTDWVTAITNAVERASS